MRAFTLLLLVIAAFAEGCASTTVTTTGSPLTEPLCLAGTAPLSTVVYWGTEWRPDQKEPERREAAALRGIQDFLSRTDCLAVVALHRRTAERTQASDEELLQSARGLSPQPERIVAIVVRELGPRLQIGIPVIVEGGTEVVIDMHVLDATTSASLASTHTQWRHGGPFVIKGVSTLAHDMSAALTATLMGPSH
ncbi:MAG: hypothetical protein U0172_01640 [Nitrospiraceae bacterium]